ncbi:MAG: SET domain-containing protein [Candidatus Geothermarchaeales archaeon]
MGLIPPAGNHFVIKKAKNKGLGVFALRDFDEGEPIFHVDLTRLKKYSVKQISENPELDAVSDHADYVGHGRYVIDHSPASYMNHSCEPNTYVKMKTIAVKDIFARRLIRRGEELIHDYTATSVDQFAGKGFWKEECKCGSNNCRGILQGDFFKLPRSLQKKYYPNLPPSTKRKHRRRFNELWGKD